LTGHFSNWNYRIHPWHRITNLAAPVFSAHHYYDRQGLFRPHCQALPTLAGQTRCSLLKHQRTSFAQSKLLLFYLSVCPDMVGKDFLDVNADLHN